MLRSRNILTITNCCTGNCLALVIFCLITEVLLSSSQAPAPIKHEYDISCIPTLRPCAHQRLCIDKNCLVTVCGYFTSDTPLGLNAGFQYHRTKGSPNTGPRASTRYLSVRHFLLGRCGFGVR